MNIIYLYYMLEIVKYFRYIYHENYSTCILCADLEGGSKGARPPPLWNLQSFISPILLEMKKLVIFHICARIHSYTSNRINPKNNNHITSIQEFLCVCNGFFLSYGWTPPGKIFWIRACILHLYVISRLTDNLVVLERIISWKN